MNSPDTALKIAKTILEFRRIRSTRLPAGLFSEIGWELLLQLFVADGEGRRLTARMAMQGSGTTEDTVSRWLKYLSVEGLVVGDGSGDIDDQLTLSAAALGMMESVLDEARQLREHRIDR